MKRWFSRAAALLVSLHALPVSAAGEKFATLPTLERVTVIAAPKAIAGFSLTDQNGKAKTLASFRGAPTLIFFGFTHCPDVCPAALTKLKLLQGLNGGALKGVQVVMISVDGERDTPVFMKQYLASISPAFIGLTGQPRAVSDIAARFAAVAYKEQADGHGGYSYFHSGQIFALDKAGQLRASFFDASVDNMATVTKLLLDE